jgi:hypothetical protein
LRLRGLDGAQAVLEHLRDPRLDRRAPRAVAGSARRAARLATSARIGRSADRARRGECAWCRGRFVLTRSLDCPAALAGAGRAHRRLALLGHPARSSTKRAGSRLRRARDRPGRRGESLRELLVGLGRRVLLVIVVCLLLRARRRLPLPGAASQSLNISGQGVEGSVQL